MYDTLSLHSSAKFSTLLPGTRETVRVHRGCLVCLCSAQPVHLYIVTLKTGVLGLHNNKILPNRNKAKT